MRGSRPACIREGCRISPFRQVFQADLRCASTPQIGERRHATGGNQGKDAIGRTAIGRFIFEKIELLGVQFCKQERKASHEENVVGCIHVIKVFGIHAACGDMVG